MIDMITNELIKTLSRQWHEAFVKQIKLDNIMKQLQQKKRMKFLQDRI